MELFCDGSTEDKVNKTSYVIVNLELWIRVSIAFLNSYMLIVSTLLLIYFVCWNGHLYVSDPVKEYGCAPWPMVEKLITKCLKENPQERPTSAQVHSC